MRPSRRPSRLEEKHDHVIALALGTTTVVDVVATQAESGRIEPYGQSVTVDGGRMNVEITGDGPRNVVLLPGFGTSSLVLDFEPSAGYGHVFSHRPFLHGEASGAQPTSRRVRR
jgi:hypothetical protein